MNRSVFLFSTCIAAYSLVLGDAYAQEVPSPPAADVSTPYYDRHKIDVSNLRDFYDGLLISDAMIRTDAMFDAETKWKMSLFQMILVGSSHYQARDAYQLSLMGVPLDEILAVWSPDYVEKIEDPRIKAAFEYIEVASGLPSRVTADTHAALRMHFIDRQIAELFELVTINGMNAVHDSVLPIPTDQETLDWAQTNLADVGWTIGASAASSADEQRANPFVGDAIAAAYDEIISRWQPEDIAAINPEFQTDWINYVTGYDVSRVTFDGDQDGIEEPFDFYPEDYNRWKRPGLGDENLPVSDTPPFDVAAYDYNFFQPAEVPETRYQFSDRHHFDTEWTRKTSIGTAYVEYYYSGKDRAFPIEFKWELFFVYQLASGCTHCQVHGAFGVYKTIEDDYFDDDIPEEDRVALIERIRALTDFERSELFTDAEKAAYRLARDAGTLPGRTTAAHIEELRRHYSNREIQEIMTAIIAGGWLAHAMQSQATVTDRLSMAWMIENMSTIGWKPGVHLGLPQEQRPYHMSELTGQQAAEHAAGLTFDLASEWIGKDVPLGVDTDSDGVEDAYDGFPSDPLRWEDTDRDGLEDALDEDIDGDGIPNVREVSLGTFPYKADSDGDGLDDLTELDAGTNPVDPRS